jgi:hypothetical protein
MRARFSNLPSPTDDLAVHEVLVAAGSEMRAGDPLPREVREWMQTISREDLARALAMQPRQAEASENLRCAALRLCVERGWEPLPPLPVVDEAEDVDGNDVHRADDASSVPLADEAMALAAPPDEIVLGYVRTGTMALYVEGVAARNPSFAEELDACIEGLAEAGTTIGERARAFRALRGEGTSAQHPYVAEATPAGDAAFPWTRHLARFALAAGLLLAVGGAAVYRSKARNAEVARVHAAEQERRLTAQQEEVDRLRRELEMKRREIQQLQAETESAATEAARSAAGARLERAHAEQQTMQANLARARAKAPPPHPSGKPECKCQPLDPMCSCL